jgi:hypothetical protein
MTAFGHGFFATQKGFRARGRVLTPSRVYGMLDCWKAAVAAGRSSLLLPVLVALALAGDGSGLLDANVQVNESRVGRSVSLLLQL